MKDILRNIRNTISSGNSQIDTFGSATLRARIIKIFYRLRSIFGNIHLPYFPRYIAYISDGDAEFFKYHRSFNGHILIRRIGFSEKSKTHGIDRVREADVIVGWAKYLSKKISLSGVDWNEVGEAIPYQLSMLAPYNPDEMCFAVKNKFENADGTKCLNIDFANCSMIIKTLEFLPRSIYPNRIIAETHVWEKYLLERQMQAAKEQQGAFVYILLYPDKATVGIVSGKAIIAPKSIDNEIVGDYEESIYGAMLTLLAQYQGHDGAANISKIYVIDYMGKAEVFLEKYGNSMPAPVEVIVQEPQMELLRKPKNASKGNMSIPPVVKQYLGIRRKAVPDINPLQSFQKPFLRKYIKSRIINLGFMMVIFMFVLALSIQVGKWKTDKYADQLQIQIAELAPDVKNLANMQKELTSIQKGSVDKPAILEILYEISEAKPSNLYFSSLNFIEGQKISLRGYSSSQGSPVGFVKNLKGIGLFKDAELKYISQKGVNNNSIIEYQIELTLNE